MRLGQFESIPENLENLSEIGDDFKSAWNALENFSFFGRGRSEADVIVPLQNRIGDRLAAINTGIASANIAQLQQWHTEVRRMGTLFLTFLRDDKFEDGRASQQAANDIMPLIDGSGGYYWLTLVSSQIARSDRGTLGSIERRMQQIGPRGGPPVPSQSFGVPRLEYPEPGHSYLPESGYLPPTAPLPTIQSAGIIPMGFGTVPWLPLAALGLLLFSRRR